MRGGTAHRAHRAGENLSTQAFTQHYHSGMTSRKAFEATEIITGIKITQGALTQRGNRL